MARPKQPPPTASDLDLRAWEDFPDLMAQCRATAATPGAAVVLTVLTNERPTARGMAQTLDFALGYEHCLTVLRTLLRGRARERAIQPSEPQYLDPASLEELAWKSKPV